MIFHMYLFEVTLFTTSEAYFQSIFGSFHVRNTTTRKMMDSKNMQTRLSACIVLNALYVDQIGLALS